LLCNSQNIMKIGCAPASTDDQNFDMQIDVLEDDGSKRGRALHDSNERPSDHESSGRIRVTY